MIFRFDLAKDTFLIFSIKKILKELFYIASVLLSANPCTVYIGVSKCNKERGFLSNFEQVFNLCQRKRYSKKKML